MARLERMSTSEKPSAGSHRRRSGTEVPPPSERSPDAISAEAAVWSGKAASPAPTRRGRSESRCQVLFKPGFHDGKLALYDPASRICGNAGAVNEWSTSAGRLISAGAAE